MRTRLLWCITLVLLCHPRLQAQTVTTQVPPATSASRSTDFSEDLPVAQVVPQPPAGVPVKIVADTQTRQPLKKGNLYTLNGNVVLYYRTYIIHADHATYNDVTGDVNAHGHLMIDGGPDDEHFIGSHGAINVRNDTGKFYDVEGTIGVERKPHGRMIFTAPNPFTITGRELEQLGPHKYRLIGGSMTSCRLPRPDWRILSHYINFDNNMATTANARFEFLHIPVMYLPYMTHPVNEQRQSGILLPIVGNDTLKGLIVGEGFYLTLGRSADLTLATQYYSKRGFAPSGMFRYKGIGRNFANIGFNSLMDRGLLLPSGKRLYQGGADVTGQGRYDLGPHTTSVLNAEYLSSYIYRLIFEDDYALAINSEVKSEAFLMHDYKDTWSSLHLSRYQNFENATITGDEVRILHMPELSFEAADHRFGGAASPSPLEWGFQGTASALSRYDYPSFRTTASVPRVDFFPRLAMPLHFDGWNLRPWGGFRETWYGKSQYPADLEQIPIVRTAGIARSAAEAGLDIRPPALERDFSTPWLRHILGGDIRHAIEPELAYRYVTGVNNFRQILRFDETDVVSDTNELEYGLTQRLFLRHLHPHPCKGDEALGPDNLCGGGTMDWVTWRVAQKHYFEPDFGNAITSGTPNPLETTLDFTGVDFLTEARNNSPVISRLRMRTTGATDLQWDLDYDTKFGKITSSNVFAGYNLGQYRFQFGDSYVNVPLGYTPFSTAKPKSLPSPDAPDQYNQIHASAIYGAVNKLGLSAGATTAYDLVHQELQYGAAQAQYNWDCCGLMFQYRRFSLGSIRNDTEYFYSINFAGIASLGDLRRRVSIF